MVEQHPQDTFDQWKEVVNLPPDFPSLKPLSGSEFGSDVGLDGFTPNRRRLYIGPNQRAIFEYVRNSWSNPGIIFLFNSGHGVSTVSNYIHQVVSEERIRYRAVPVKLQLDNMHASDQEFGEDVRVQVVKNVLLGNWGPLLPPEQYASLLGVEGIVNPADKNFTKVMYARSLVARATIEESWEMVGNITPNLALPLEELLRHLHEHRFLRVGFGIDLSSSKLEGEEYRAAIATLVNRVSVIQDRVGNQSSPFGLQFFANPESYQLLDRHYWPGNLDVVKVPAFQPLDIFAMLALQYHASPDQVPDQNARLPSRPHLATIVDPSFLLIPGVYDPGLSLREIIKNFARELRISANTGYTSYRLSPTPEQMRRIAEIKTGNK